MIGLSPLPTGHPLSFQPQWVRPSTRSYPRFSLPMGSSLGFGSRASNLTRPVRTRFRFGSPYNRLTSLLTANSSAHFARGTPSPPQRGLRLLVGTRFQVLFHSPPGVLFTFPSRYLSTIGRQRVFSLMGWSPPIRTEFLGLRTTREHQREARGFRLQGYYLLWPTVPGLFDYPRALSLPEGMAAPCCWLPRPRCGNACQLSSHTGLGCSPFARHY